MKKLVLSTIIAAAGAGIAYAAKQGKLKPATDKMKPALDRVMSIPLVAAAVDKVNGLRKQAANDDSMKSETEAA